MDFSQPAPVEGEPVAADGGFGFGEAPAVNNGDAGFGFGETPAVTEAPVESVEAAPDLGFGFGAPAQDEEPAAEPAADLGFGAPAVEQEAPAAMLGGFDMPAETPPAAVEAAAPSPIMNAFQIVSPKLQEVRDRVAKEREERRQGSQTRLEEMRATGKASLDAFYAERQAKIDATRKLNEEAEAAAAEALASGSSWEKVASYCNLADDGGKKGKMQTILLELKHNTSK